MGVFPGVGEGDGVNFDDDSDDNAPPDSGAGVKSCLAGSGETLAAGWEVGESGAVCSTLVVGVGCDDDMFLGAVVQDASKMDSVHNPI